MDDDQYKRLKKNYLKLLPIWSELEELQSTVKRITKDLDRFSTRQNSRLRRFDQLVNPNLTNELKIIPHKEPSCDNSRQEEVKFYKKINGEYVCKDPNDTVGENEGRLACLKSLGAPIQVDEDVYAMVKPRKPWVLCKVIVVYNKPNRDNRERPITTFRLRLPPEFDSRVISASKYAVARIKDFDNKLEPPKRVIAGHSKDQLYPGTIVYEPFEWSLNRYLVMMDDGSAQYFKHNQMYPIVGQTLYPWFDPRFLSDKNRLRELCLRDFLLHYPTRNLLKAAIGDPLNIYRDGELTSAILIQEDCDVMKLRYESDGKEENVYRGSVRVRGEKDFETLLKDMRNPLADQDIEKKFYAILVINCKAYYDAGCRATNEDILRFAEDFGKVIVSKRKPDEEHLLDDSPTALDVYLDSEDWDPDSDDQSSSTSSSKHHRCTEFCLENKSKRSELSVDLLNDFRDICDLKVPLVLGWKRYLVKVPTVKGRVQRVVYEAPCGKTFKSLHYLKIYLVRTNSKLDIDYFCIDPSVDPMRKIPPTKAYHFVKNLARDYDTHIPLENKNISVINQYSEEELPMDFKYRNESFPHPKLEREGFSLNTDFKSGCDCLDDCQQKSTCACHRLTEEAFGISEVTRSNRDPQCHYIYKRLPDLVSTGIFECNSLCKCSSKCGNRVVQNGIRFRLQVSKTVDKGWGVVTLDDIPRGSFVCTYAAEILDDANQYGDDDMYFADLDYVTVNEYRKQILDCDNDDDTGVETDSSSVEICEVVEAKTKDTECSEDCSDSLYSTNGNGTSEDSRKRRVPKAKKTTSPAKALNLRNKVVKEQQNDIVRQIRPKFRRIHDILNSHDFTLDARLSGNIGRFCNHSCDPNTYVQNVFIETHDLRFPIVAMFTSRVVKANEEIVWDYGYVMGSIPERIMLCNCGSSNCRGRIL